LDATPFTVVPFSAHSHVNFAKMRKGKQGQECWLERTITQAGRGSAELPKYVSASISP
jgi:hypothetical protein